MPIAFWYMHHCKTVERFSGYTQATELNSSVVAEFIMKQVSGLALGIGNYVSQCYDGASDMSGNNTGVQTL